jgi:type IV pilus assembly protein PilX
MVSAFGKVTKRAQKGLVLFVALIALVVMSLAAVALIRSVDTNTMIAGNIAYKQSATTAADAGIEAAIGWLTATELANSTLNVLTDATHPFNITNEANGYYSNADDDDPSDASDTFFNLFDENNWDEAHAGPEIVDGNGNRVRYIIQRLCRTPNVILPDADCLFSSEVQDTGGQEVPLPENICSGPGCPKSGQAPQLRITARAVGPKNTVSYVQAFVY